MEKHEVVIVGAGPAGLKAAELLGNAKKDVLVIERKKKKRSERKLRRWTDSKNYETST